jgi:hypothetical protein
MHSLWLMVTSVAAVLALASASAAQAPPQVKNVPYPEVKVNVGDAYQQDAAFKRMRDAFVRATTRRDAGELMRLVGPTFLWTRNLMPTDSFDMGRDAVHNFKVAFGFRVVDSSVDGGVQGGAQWSALAAFAAESIFFEVAGVRNMVCGPMAAEILDDEVFERARQTIESSDGGADWHFIIGDVAVARAPGDVGAPIARLSGVAVPVLGTHPRGSAPTHVQVLLSSGRPGWVPVSATRPLVSDRLCFGKTADGEWRIVAYDQAG